MKKRSRQKSPKPKKPRQPSASGGKRKRKSNASLAIDDQALDDDDPQAGNEDDEEDEQPDTEDEGFIDNSQIDETRDLYHQVDNARDGSQSADEGDQEEPAEEDMQVEDDLTSGPTARRLRRAFGVRSPNADLAPVDIHAGGLNLFFTHFVKNYRASIQRKWGVHVLRGIYEDLKRATNQIMEAQTVDDFATFFQLRDKATWTDAYLKDEKLRFLQGIIGLNICCLREKVIADHSECTNAFDRLKSFNFLCFDYLAIDFTKKKWSEGKAIAVNSYDIELRNLNNCSPSQRVLLKVLQILQNLNFRRYRGNCYSEVEIAFWENPDGNRWFETYAQADKETGTLRNGDPDCKVLRFFHTGSWKEECSIPDFISKRINKETEWATWQDLNLNPKDLVHNLEFGIHREFPELKPNRELRSFRNGVLDSSFDNPRWIPFSIDRPEEEMICCKHYDMEFDSDYGNTQCWKHIPTPCFDKVLTDQKLDLAPRFWVYAFFGRLIYPLNKHDMFHSILFTKGDANTGKSTLASIAESFYLPEDVATLSSNIEEVFGLSAIYDKLLYVCAEVTKGWKLNKGDTNSIITGDRVSIAIKTHTARTVQWLVPGLLFGNQFGSWIDFEGALQRRFFLLLFTHKIIPDPLFQKKIEQEIPLLIRKCALAYRAAVLKDMEKDFWSHKVPQYFRDAREKASLDLNPVKEWILKSEQFEICKDYEGKIDTTKCVPVAHVNKLWAEHTKQRLLKNVVKASEMENTLLSLGCEIVTKSSRGPWGTVNGRHYVGLMLVEAEHMRGPDMEVASAPLPRSVTHSFNGRQLREHIKERLELEKTLPPEPRQAAASHFCSFFSSCPHR